MLRTCPGRSSAINIFERPSHGAAQLSPDGAKTVLVVCQPVFPVDTVDTLPVRTTTRSLHTFCHCHSPFSVALVSNLTTRGTHARHLNFATLWPTVWGQHAEKKYQTTSEYRANPERAQWQVWSKHWSCVEKGSLTRRVSKTPFKSQRFLLY